VDSERIRERLLNIRTVEPILGALRTISLGSWQAALNQRAGLLRYTEQLQLMLPQLLPYLSPRPTLGGLWRRYFPGAQPNSRPVPRRVTAVIVGSERGLCGGFNAVVGTRAIRYFEQSAAGNVEAALVTWGGRVRRLLERNGYTGGEHQSLSVTALPSFALAFDYTRVWLRRYEAEELDAVDLIYNAYHGVGQYTPTVARLIPPDIPPAPETATDPFWPPAIVETDPLALYVRVVEQWTAINFYARLLDAATAEHATRYQLMESATQNADRLIEELTMESQALRRQAITREMQELAVGAGLLGT